MANSTFPLTFSATFTNSLEQPAEEIRRLLRQTTAWTGDAPDAVELLHETTGQTKENRNGEFMYVWEPIAADIQRFSADGVRYDWNPQVEIIITTLESADQGTRATQLQRDVIDILAGFMDDNKERTNFNNIEPVGTDDLRNEFQARFTNHHVMAVQCELRQHNS